MRAAKSFHGFVENFAAEQAAQLVKHKHALAGSYPVPVALCAERVRFCQGHFMAGGSPGQVTPPVRKQTEAKLLALAIRQTSAAPTFPPLPPRHHSPPLPP